MASGDICLQEVKNYLANHPKVILAFLFGSFAKDMARVASDVDLAVFLDPSYTKEDVKAIWSKLEDLTGRDVDLLIINQAPPGISWTAMKGKVLVDKNPRLRLELMLQISREAEDFREFQMDFWRLRRQHWGESDAPVNT